MLRIVIVSIVIHSYEFGHPLLYLLEGGWILANTYKRRDFLVHEHF